MSPFTGEARTLVDSNRAANRRDTLHRRAPGHGPYRAAVQASLDREAEQWDRRKREILAERRESDEALMRGYRQLSLGMQVISLQDTIRAGGEDDQQRPRLAIARADEQTIRMARRADGSVTFEGGWQRADHRDPRTRRNVSVPAGTLSRLPDRQNGWAGETVFANATVPIVPPRLRPGTLERYHILWEAEWRRVAPRDPALLRALGDGLYAVLAVWDLTELERAVLGIRMQ
jgi:hypothetical protein